MENKWIWIVIGQGNFDHQDYGDAEDWYVIAYSNGEEAILHAALAEAVWNTLPKPKTLHKGFNKYDPEIPHEYDSVRYYVRKVRKANNMENDYESD